MTDKQTTCDPINYLIDSFWATLPEKTADDLASFKKDVLKGIKDSVDWLIDSEVEATDRHVENARKVRQEWQAKSSESAEDVPPTPA